MFWCLIEDDLTLNACLYCRKTEHVWTGTKHFLCVFCSQFVIETLCCSAASVVFLRRQWFTIQDPVESFWDVSWTQLGSGGSHSPRPITITRSGGARCSDWPSRWSGGWSAAPDGGCSSSSAYFARHSLSKLRVAVCSWTGVLCQCDVSPAWPISRGPSVYLARTIGKRF